MPENFADQLLSAISLKRTPIVVGLDPVYERLPAAIREHKELNDSSDSEIALDAIFEFAKRVVKIVSPHVAAVKINSAFFEKYLWGGTECYYSLIQEAAAQELLVIGDVKRGDVSHSAECYATAHLSDPEFSNLDDWVSCDAVTVNPYLGIDTVQPFIDVALEESKGLFVLVRTTNEGAAEIQDFQSGDGTRLCEHVADLVSQWAGQEGAMGTRGYSAVGCVVAADDPERMAAFRQRMPHCLFLIPGYGVQNAQLEAIKAGFKSDGTGAIVSASRSLLFAYEDPHYTEQFPDSWEKCIEQAVLDMKLAVNTAIN